MTQEYDFLKGHLDAGLGDVYLGLYVQDLLNPDERILRDRETELIERHLDECHHCTERFKEISTLRLDPDEITPKVFIPLIKNTLVN